MPQATRYLQRPATQVRRKDRALTEPEWMDRMLAMAAVGHLALSWEGQPLIHSNLYWLDGDRIYFHTAAVGKLRAVLDTGEARAAFTVTELGRLLSADSPLDFSAEYASVVVYGTVRVVTDPEEKRRGLEGLMSKYAPQFVPGVDYQLMPERDIDQTSVFCLEIESRVGKHNVKPADHPAYEYSGGSFIEAERQAGRLTIREKDVS